MSAEAPKSAEAQPKEQIVASTSQATAPEQAPFKVWNPPKSTAGTPATLDSSSLLHKEASLPDSYFEPTQEEVKALYQAQVRATKELIDAPLRTQELRDREAKAKAARYPTVRIRIKFPDQTQLERTFPATDKIRSVCAFVRNSLREDVKPIKFILYQSPPRREFRVSDPNVKEKTLYELGLAPSSILLLDFLDVSLNHVTVRAPLSDEIWAVAQDLPAPPTLEEAPSAETSNRSRLMNAGSSSNSGTSGEKKVPKWFKVGQKK